jgi:hypothetical protein
MGKIITNLVIVLGFITIAFAGYYMLVQQGESGLGFNSSEQLMQNMLSNTQMFISRRQALDRVDLIRSVGIFEDSQFRSLRSFSTDIEERPIGRENPFDPAVLTNNVNTAL